jgi:hypothetical protein
MVVAEVGAARIAPQPSAPCLAMRLLLARRKTDHSF